MIVAYGNGTLEVLTLSRRDPQGFSPAPSAAERADVSAVWSILPDDLAELPSADQKALELAWMGLLQTAAGVLQETLHLDQASSLLDFPVRVPRRWVELKIKCERDMAAGDIDTFRTEKDAGVRFTPGVDADNPSVLTVTTGGRHAGLRHAWRSAVSGDCSFRAELDFKGTAALSLPEGWLLLGAGAASAARLAQGVYGAVSSHGRIAAVVVEDRVSRWTIPSGSTTLEGTLQVEYRGAWRGRPGRVRVQLGTLQTEAEVGIPFVSSDVVLVPFDTRVQVQQGPVLGPSGKMQVEVQRLRVWDASLPKSIVAIPTLATTVSSPPTLMCFQHYEVVSTSAGDTALSSSTVLPDTVWAENCGLDLRLLEQVFGPLVGVDGLGEGPDTRQLRNQLACLLWGLLRGPHADSLAVAVGGVCGLPVAVAAGTVTGINRADIVPTVTIRSFDRTRVYEYPAEATLRVKEGQDVAKLEPLCELPRILDWTSPSFLTEVGFGRPGCPLARELEKFNSVLVQLPSFVAEDAQAVTHVRAYLERAIAVWAGVTRLVLRFVSAQGDDLGLADDVAWAGTLTLYDALTGATAQRYDDEREFRYDESFEYDADVAILADHLSVSVTNTGGSPLTLTIFGDSFIVGPGDTETVEEPA